VISNWLAFAVLVYGLGVGAHWWPGPITSLRHFWDRRRHRRTPEASDTQNRWSDTSDTDEDDDTDMSVSDTPEGDDDLPMVEHAPGVYSQPDPRVKIVRLPAGPRPLDDLRREHGLTDTTSSSEGTTVPVGSSPAARRAWVRQQLRAGVRSGDIVTRGAARWGCSAKTIERDLAMQRVKEERIRRRR
jgi:hypothetical protein